MGSEKSLEEIFWEKEIKRDGEGYTENETAE
jgi:hypothetical protein